MSTALVLFRRDLRVADNAALSAACTSHEKVLPVFTHSPDDDGEWTSGAASRWWLHHSLAALDVRLRASNAGLHLRQAGQPARCAACRDPAQRRQQPEAGKTTDFHIPAKLGEDRIYLGGQWQRSDEYHQSAGPGVIGLNYIAQAPYVVLDTAGGAKKVEVTLDGKPVPPAYRGIDITASDGKTWMNVTEPRLYWPIDNRAPYGRHTIRFKVPAGVRLYSFTFGAYQPAKSHG